MARDDKNFNIPRGDDEYDAIRQNLRARIQNYEESVPKQNVSKEIPQNNSQNAAQAASQVPQQSYSHAQAFRPAQQSRINQNQQTSQFQTAQTQVQPQINHAQQPQVNPVQQPQAYPAQQPQQKMSYQQYQQNIGRQSAAPNTNPFRQQSQVPNNANAYNQNATYSQQNMRGYSQPAQNSYSQQGYSSPFAQQTNQDVTFRGAPQAPAMASANHSKEPVMYKPKKRQSAAKTFGILIIMVALVFGLSWGLRQFVFQAYEIPSGSMEKTIMTGDMVFAEKITYKFRGPQPGEIVTFDDPINSGRILIKRVIATEGQKIDIKNNKLYIDGVEQDEDYVNDLPTSQLRSANVSYPYTVPEGEIWVMGDNRTNSQDSRYFGSIPVSSVIGKAVVVYWPFDDARSLI